MLNVSPTRRKAGRDHSMTPRKGRQRLHQAGVLPRAISTWLRLDCFKHRTERGKADRVGKMVIPTLSWTGTCPTGASVPTQETQPESRVNGSNGRPTSRRPG